MAERQLAWKSVEDFAMQQPEHETLVKEAGEEFLSKSNPQSVTTRGMTPRYLGEDANGNEIVFPITLKVEI